MKKKISFILLIILSFVLISCKKVEKDEIEQEAQPYLSYLSDDNPVVIIIVKDFGVMKAQLFKDVAPNTVNNFIKYISDKKYNNSSFHRIIETFMIQGGIVSNTNRPIAGEFISNGFNNELNHYRGILSMARTNDPNSATSQFFVMHKTSPHLDGNYASFGGLISGFEVLDLIAAVNTNFYDAPLENVIIEKIEIRLNGYNPESVIYFGN